MAAIRQAGRWACGSALLAAVIVAMLVLLPSLFGWQRYAIVSGSMTGTYDKGTLVLDEVVPVADLKVGDVITYLPPSGAGPDHLITHRIAWIGKDPTGGRDLPHQGRRQPGRRPVDVPPQPAHAGACPRRRPVRRPRAAGRSRARTCA